jgi:hypothetical protein
MDTNTEYEYKINGTSVSNYSYDCIPTEGGIDCKYINLIYNATNPTVLGGTTKLAP